MKSTTDHLSAVTHAAEAARQETHCSCTRHVPRRVPHPCLCTRDVMKSTTHHLLAATRAAEAATQETHCSCTRHVPRRVPRPCPCTLGVMKSTTHHLSAVTHAAEAATQETHCSCTRHVPRRMPRPCPCTTGVMKSRKNIAFNSSHTCSRGHGTEDTRLLHKAHTKAHASSMPVHSWRYIINNQAQHCMLNIHHLSRMQQRPRHTRHAHGRKLP